MDTQTDAQMQTGFMICPMLYAIDSYGADNYANSYIFNPNTAQIVMHVIKNTTSDTR